MVFICKKDFINIKLNHPPSNSLVRIGFFVNILAHCVIEVSFKEC